MRARIATDRIFLRALRGGRCSGRTGATASTASTTAVSIALACLTACATGGAADTSVAPAPGSVELILHDPTGRDAPRDTCDVRLCTSLLELIEGAETSIDFALYGMRAQTQILDAIRAARARGVRIRGVVDRDAEGHNIYANTGDLVAAVEDVHSDLETDRRMAEDDGFTPSPPRCARPEGFDGPVQCLTYDLGEECLVAAHASREAFESAGAIMHDKFFIVDGRYVWTGSTNVSSSGTGGYNANLVVRIDSPRVARWYTEEFEQMYERGLYHGDKETRPERRITLGETELELLFSPQDRPITRRVRRLLRDARERVDIAVFYLTHKGITADLIAAHRRGVRVRVIVDATSATNGYTKHELLRAAGIPVIVEHWGGKMHMKSAAIDGEYVIAGSMNWTTAGESGNDENTLILRSAALAGQFHGFYDRMWAGLGERYLTGRPDPESRESSTACTDGSDNDHDGLSDAEDPGCGENPPPLSPLPPWRVVPMREGVCDVDDAEVLRSGR